MGADSERTTAVVIDGHTYHVRGGDPEHVRRLARHLDQRMREVLADTNTVDSLKVAVLAGLRIAEDFFRSDEKLQSLREDISQRSERMIKALEAADPP